MRLRALGTASRSTLRSLEPWPRGRAPRLSYWRKTANARCCRACRRYEMDLQRDLPSNGGNARSSADVVCLADPGAGVPRGLWALCSAGRSSKGVLLCFEGAAGAMAGSWELFTSRDAVAAEHAIERAAATRLGAVRWLGAFARCLRRCNPMCRFQRLRRRFKADRWGARGSRCTSRTRARCMLRHAGGESRPQRR